MKSKLYVIQIGEWRYGIPIEHILRNAAEYFSRYEPWNGDVEGCLKGEIEEWSYEKIEDWAVGNMDWDDVESVAVLLPKKERELTYRDFLDAWKCGGEIHEVEIQ